MAVAHVFGAVAVPVFSAIWFPSSQRAISTSILFFATILGGGSGFIFGPWVTQSVPSPRNSRGTKCTSGERWGAKTDFFFII